MSSLNMNHLNISGSTTDNLRRYIEGWLEHKEKRKYIRHWFVLKGKVNTSAQLEKAYLFCFKSENTKDKTQFVGSTEIVFPGGSVTLLKSSVKKSKFTFKIQFNHTKFNFKADDDQTRQKWIYAFCYLVGKQFPPMEIPSEIKVESEKKTPLMSRKILPNILSSSTNDINKASVDSSSIRKSSSWLHIGSPSNEDKEKRAVEPPQNKQLSQISWYCPGMTRNQAEEILTIEAVGTFLLRDSESHSGNYTLTYRDIDKIKNHMICSTDKGQYKFCETEIKQLFSSPSEAAIMFMFTAKHPTTISPKAYVRSPTDKILEPNLQPQSKGNLKYNYLDAQDIQVDPSLAIRIDSLNEKREKSESLCGNESDHERDSVYMDDSSDQSYLEGNYVDDTLAKVILDVPVLPEKPEKNNSIRTGSLLNGSAVPPIPDRKFSVEGPLSGTPLNGNPRPDSLPSIPVRKVSVEANPNLPSKTRKISVLKYPPDRPKFNSLPRIISQEPDSYNKMDPDPPNLSCTDAGKSSEKEMDSSIVSSNINKKDICQSVNSINGDAEPNLVSSQPDRNSYMVMNPALSDDSYMEVNGGNPVPVKEIISHPDLPPPRKSLVKPESLNLSTKGSKYININDTLTRFPPALMSSSPSQSSAFSVDNFFLGKNPKIDSPKSEHAHFVTPPDTGIPPLPPRCEKPLRLSKLS